MASPTREKRGRTSKGCFGSDQETPCLSGMSASAGRADVRLRSASCHSQTLARAILFGCETNPSAVPSLALGGVQGMVGTTQDRTPVVPQQGLGDPSAEGVGQVDPVPVPLGGGKAVPDPVDDADGFVVPGPRDDQQELLASHPAKHILSPHPLAADVGKMPEHGITCLVPMGIVDVLEPID